MSTAPVAAGINIIWNFCAAIMQARRKTGKALGTPPGARPMAKDGSEGLAWG
jgi:hypothetical protein